MSLKTRLDGRSKDNNSFMLKDSQGNDIAKVRAIDSNGLTLEITTIKGHYIEKPSGWNSKQKEVLV